MTEGQTNSTEISEGVVTEIQRDSRQHYYSYIFLRTGKSNVCTIEQLESYLTLLYTVSVD